MNRKILIPALCGTLILGSLFMVLASNMFFSDIMNIGVVTEPTSTMIATLPAATMAIFFIVLLFYLVRLAKHPDCGRRLTRLYSIYAVVLGVLGVNGAILTGTKVYGTFVGPHPFPGYALIFLFLNLLVAAAGFVGLYLRKKKKEDTGRIKNNVLHVIATIGAFFYIALMYNRFGTLLGLPSYVYWRNFDETFLFYLSLLLPVYLGFLELLHLYQCVKRKTFLILTLVALGLHLFFFTYTVLMGLNSTAFISSISAAMPIERILSKPIEIVIHFVVYCIFLLILFLQNRKKKED